MRAEKIPPLRLEAEFRQHTCPATRQYVASLVVAEQHEYRMTSAIGAGRR